MAKLSPLGSLYRITAHTAAKLLGSCLLLFALQAQALPFLCRQSLGDHWETTYEFLIIHPESIEVALPLAGGGFEYHRVNSWQDVQQLLVGLPREELQKYHSVLELAKAQFQTVADHVRRLGRKHHGQVQIRIKADESLRAKVVQKSQIYQLNNKLFTVDDISDLIAARLILPLTSPLLRMADQKTEWASALSIPVSSILKVEIKGAASPTKNANPYRAIHIDLQGENGIPYELQVMSRLTYLWHSWDHATVHKPKGKDGEELRRLRQYSHRWMRLIAEIEDVVAAGGEARQVQRLFRSIGIRDETSTDWMIETDARFRAEFSISAKDSLLTMGYRGRPHQSNGRLLKELHETLKLHDFSGS